MATAKDVEQAERQLSSASAASLAELIDVEGLVLAFRRSLVHLGQLLRAIRLKRCQGRDDQLSRRLDRHVRALADTLEQVDEDLRFQYEHKRRVAGAEFARGDDKAVSSLRSLISELDVGFRPPLKASWQRGAETDFSELHDLAESLRDQAIVTLLDLAARLRRAPARSASNVTSIASSRQSAATTNSTRSTGSRRAVGTFAEGDVPHFPTRRHPTAPTVPTASTASTAAKTDPAAAAAAHADSETMAKWRISRQRKEPPRLRLKQFLQRDAQPAPAVPPAPVSPLAPSVQMDDAVPPVPLATPVTMAMSLDDDFEATDHASLLNAYMPPDLPSPASPPPTLPLPEQLSPIDYRASKFSFSQASGPSNQDRSSRRSSRNEAATRRQPSTRRRSSGQAQASRSKSRRETRDNVKSAAPPVQPRKSSRQHPNPMMRSARSEVFRNNASDDRLFRLPDGTIARRSEFVPPPLAPSFVHPALRSPEEPLFDPEYRADDLLEAALMRGLAFREQNGTTVYRGPSEEPLSAPVGSMHAAAPWASPANASEAASPQTESNMYHGLATAPIPQSKDFDTQDETAGQSLHDIVSTSLDLQEQSPNSTDVYDHNSGTGSSRDAISPSSMDWQPGKRTAKKPLQPASDKQDQAARTTTARPNLRSERRAVKVAPLPLDKNTITSKTAVQSSLSAHASKSKSKSEAKSQTSRSLSSSQPSTRSTPQVLTKRRQSSRKNSLITSRQNAMESSRKTPNDKTVYDSDSNSEVSPTTHRAPLLSDLTQQLSAEGLRLQGLPRSVHMEEPQQLLSPSSSSRHSSRQPSPELEGSPVSDEADPPILDSPFARPRFPNLSADRLQPYNGPVPRHLLPAQQSNGSRLPAGDLRQSYAASFVSIGTSVIDDASDMASWTDERNASRHHLSIGTTARTSPLTPTNLHWPYFSADSSKLPPLPTPPADLTQFPAPGPPPKVPPPSVPAGPSSLRPGLDRKPRTYNVYPTPPSTTTDQFEATSATPAAKKHRRTQSADVPSRSSAHLSGTSSKQGAADRTSKAAFPEPAIEAFEEPHPGRRVSITQMRYSGSTASPTLERPHTAHVEASSNGRSAPRRGLWGAFRFQRDKSRKDADELPMLGQVGSLEKNDLMNETFTPTEIIPLAPAASMDTLSSTTSGPRLASVSTPPPPPPPSAARSLTFPGDGSSERLALIPSGKQAAAVPSEILPAMPGSTSGHYLPEESNQYAGFCKGAWRLQVGPARKAYGLRVKPSGLSATLAYTQCEKCAFAGTCVGNSANPNKRLPDLEPRNYRGVLISWTFLFKSHLHAAAPGGKLAGGRNAHEVLPADARYGCVFCAASAKGTPVYDGLAAFVAHMHEHRRPEAWPVGEAAYRMGCIAGRTPSPGEAFDICLPPLSA